MGSREIDINQVTLPQLVGRGAEVSEIARGDIKLPPKSLVEEPQSHIQVNQDAHRRWRGNFAVDFIGRVNSVEIRNSRKLADGTEVYMLEVSLRGDTTLTVERSFSDFQVLRDNVLNAVSLLPICTCPYCVDFLLYIRYKLKQPRRITKLITGTEKRKNILCHFMKDFITMGKRRVQKIGKAKCGAQTLVPLLLDAILPKQICAKVYYQPS